ncbi:MAG TPA: hypothetical protein PK289_12900 [Bacteroidia bacterium]|nr:hypothetical protein [Bacteroidia bacterium]
MSSVYKLQVDVSIEKQDLLNRVLGFPDSTDPYWEIVIEENSERFDCAIEFLLGLLENNYSTLIRGGIYGENISLWFLYEYDQQCNMEFNPDHLKRLGTLGITLCVSCWQK